MFWINKIDPEYWLRIVTGTFGAGKTKNTFLEAFLRKQQNPNWVVISNIPYKDINGDPLVDIVFSSKNDLREILKHVFTYLKDTNEDQFLREEVFPPIRIIIDEAHLYYFSRDFKAFDLEMMTILTQCRKRLVTIYFITQELWQIDKFLRRLCPEVIVYTRWSFNLTEKNLMYFISTEKSDVADEMNVECLSTQTIRRDWLRLFFDKSLQAFFDQKYLTNFICGASDLYLWSYPEFKEFLSFRRNEILLDMEYEKWDSPSIK